MAYRTFRNEETYAAPQADFLPNTLEVVKDAVKSREAEKRRRLVAAEQAKVDVGEGKFTRDQDFIHEGAKQLLPRIVNEYLNHGRESLDSKTKRMELQNATAQSQIDFQRMNELQQSVTGANDKYYDKKVDLDKIQRAAYGDDKEEVDFRNRSQRFGQLQLGDVDTFKYNDFKADFVNRKKTEKLSNIEKSSGVKKSILTEAVFTDEHGNPKVTDEHAIEMLKSDPRVEQLFDKQMNAQLDKEIAGMKASGDPRVSWMKGKSDAEIKNELINDPSKNLINSQNYGQRKREMVKNDLELAQRINRKTSTEVDTNNQTNGLYKNNKIVQDYTFHNPTMTGFTGGEAKPTISGAPGGNILMKDGKPIKFNSYNARPTNVNTGLTPRNSIGNYQFNLTGYQLQPFRTNGAPFALDANNIDEAIAKVNNLPLEYFDPNGQMKLAPELNIALNGYTINKANLLNDANIKTQGLNSQIAQAIATGDAAKAEGLQYQLDQINALKGILGNDDISDQDIQLAAQKAGIKDIQTNQMIKANDSDLSSLNAITGGFNLRDKSKWSEDMIRFDEAYRNRAREAAEKGYAASKSKPKSKTTKPSIKLPKIGEVKNGYKFVGGDPSKPESWEKQ